jgi:hypothetical protein
MDEVLKIGNVRHSIVHLEAKESCYLPWDAIHTYGGAEVQNHVFALALGERSDDRPGRCIIGIPCIGSSSDPRLAELNAVTIATAGSRTHAVASYYSDCALCDLMILKPNVLLE